MSDMVVKVLPTGDNYMYLIIDDSTGAAAVVDPVKPDIILQQVAEENVHLQAILTTHHHRDHSAGNMDLVEKVEDIEVFGGSKKIPGLTVDVIDGQTFTLGTLEVQCVLTPCHTEGCVSYLIGEPEKPEVIFTGDTLFVGGCGKWYEGDSEMAYESIINKIGEMDNELLMYCGHEYTIQNLKFAELIEPENYDLKCKLLWAEERRKNNEPTVPSTIGEEKLFNPFLRVNEEEMQERFGNDGDGIETMKDLQNKRDALKPSHYM